MQYFEKSSLRKKIVAESLMDETQAMHNVLSLMNWSEDLTNKSYEYGKGLAEYIRSNMKKNPMDSFMEEYSLSDAEGVLLMCLAEAMMRIPDKATQDAFISDVISQGQWDKHISKDKGFLVNAGSWGLLLTGKIVHMDKNEQKRLRAWLKTCSNPFIRKGVRQAMKFMGQKYVLGETIEKAFKAADKMTKKGYRYSFDMLGEGARSMKDAQRYLESYKAAIHKIGKNGAGEDIQSNHGISIKLSALYPRYEITHSDACLSYLGSVLQELCLLAKNYNIGLNVDAEEVSRLDLSLELFAQILHDEQFEGWDGFGVVIQTYQKQAAHAIDYLYEIAKENNRRIMLRLVKGAYWDSEIKHYQQMGAEGYPVWTQKINSDVHYVHCAEKLFAYGDVIFPQFATHNAATVGAVLAIGAQYPDVAYEFQRLHGMGEELHAAVVEHIHKVPSRIYAPVGPYEDLLSYLVRRLLENGANSSFVNHIGNQDVPLDLLLEDVVQSARKQSNHAHPKIPLPAGIYGEKRQNAKGLNLDNPLTYAEVSQYIQQPFTLHAHSLLHQSKQADADKTEKVYAPFDPDLYLGTQQSAKLSDMDNIIQDAYSGLRDWSKKPVKERAKLLYDLADDMEEHMLDYMRICILEAGKTYSDAVAEIREAIDFCRYYGLQAEQNTMPQYPTGIWVCISPWNFPLAIFLGQVSAALVTGNVVIAKPAEQTSMIAYFTVQRMYQLGFGRDVLQLVIGKGSVIGDALTKRSELAGVCFTGSTATAKIIQNNMAQSGASAVLIAETGGQNVMIVDSTALAEQVSDDVMRSSFQSAGQRCSALRILCIQEDVADHMIEMIIGGLKELTIGSPLHKNCDVAPVIDQTAMGKLNQYIADKQSEFKMLYQLPKSEYMAEGGSFVLPTIFEIDDLSQMGEEQFGPILHILRYKQQDLSQLLTQINQLGYGLTAGLHSRIKQRWANIADTLNVGNIYINRNQIGAIVGAQPFGGEGLSGTGPKAGGPNYLPRFTKMLPQAYDNAVDAGSTTNSWDCAQEVWPFDKCQTVLSLWRAQLAQLQLDDENLSMMTYLLDQWINHPPINLHGQERLVGTTGEENYLQILPKFHTRVDFDTAKLSDLWGIMVAIQMGHYVYVTKPLPESWIAFLQAGHQSALPIAMVEEGLHFDVFLSDMAQKEANIAASAAQQGAIGQLVMSEELIAQGLENQVLWNQDLLMRFCREKTVSIDTARTGGNVELLSLC